MINRSAQISVMELLRQEQQKIAVSPTSSILFLTPCHTTPYYSYIHQNISMRFLDCSPPGWEKPVHELNRKEISWLLLPSLSTGERSQRQEFEADPVGYLQSVFRLNKSKKSSHPGVIVGYSQLMNSKHMSALLKAWGYSRHKVLNNCWIQTDENNECSIDVWHR